MNNVKPKEERRPFVSRISGKHKIQKNAFDGLNDTGKLKTAVFLDVDGTLAGKYHNGKRELA
jgi:hypothetical protein